MADEAERLRILFTRAAPARLDRARRILQSVGQDPTREIDLLGLTREVLASLYHALTDQLLRPSPEDAQERWQAYKNRLSRRFLSDVEWIRNRRGAPSKDLVRRLRECQQNSWSVHHIVYVRPTRHSGIDVGYGMFALLPLRRGQMLFQFTGSVHPYKDGFFKKNKGRENYAMNMRYGDTRYIVNPLVEKDTMLSPTHLAGYINEPSPPPWKAGDIVQDDTGRNAIVRRYTSKSGDYQVEYANGSLEDVPATLLSPHPLSPPVPRVYEANVFWYDFPVPLNVLYSPHGSRDGQLVYRRTKQQTVPVVWNDESFHKVFTSVATPAGLYRMTKAVQVQVGHMVFMKDDVFAGLERYGIVRAVTASAITVLHTVNSSTAWRLPRTTLAGKVRRCAQCTQVDDPRCQRCTVVPFPVVHACRDIRPGEEILCLYGRVIRTRGLGCQTPLEVDDMGPPWDEHY